MENFKVVRYSSLNYNEWNEFILKAKNATFLFHRDFMEYHEDRFEDFSLMVYCKDKLVALFPANGINNQVYSHQGLSYGGFIVLNTIKVKDYLLAFKSMLLFLDSKKIEYVYLKELPLIYHTFLAREIDYVLDVLKAKTISTDSYFVIENLKAYKPNRNRKRALKLAKENLIKVSDEHLDLFWENILTKNLKERYNTKPVHTIDEIELLMRRFPNQIKFYSAIKNHVLKAGVVVFVFEKVVHFQYSSGDDDRDETGSLDFLFDYIIKKYNNKEYISFGSGSIDKTLKVSMGLSYWKESFGAKLIPQKFYCINTENYLKLNDVFI